MEPTRRVCQYCTRRLLGITVGPSDGDFKKRVVTVVCAYCDKMATRKRR